jgi:DNA-directed RNA polymerase subunit RPC12/RpoP
MQCPNCDREIIVEDGQFCPYCASPLNITGKSKRKNDHLQSPPTFMSPVTAGILGVTVALAAGLFVMQAFSISPIVYGVCAIGGIGVVSVFVLNGHRCSRCGSLFTMKRVNRKRIGSRTADEEKGRNGKHPYALLRVTYEDEFQCSVCGFEEKRIFIDSQVASNKQKRGE